MNTSAMSDALRQLGEAIIAVADAMNASDVPSMVSVSTLPDRRAVLAAGKRGELRLVKLPGKRALHVDAGELASWRATPKRVDDEAAIVASIVAEHERKVARRREAS